MQNIAQQLFKISSINKYLLQAPHKAHLGKF